MSLQVITNNEQFIGLKSEWTELTQEPLRSFEWHFAWWKNLSENRELRIYTFEVDGQVVGIAPFYIDSWLGQQRLRFIGSGSTCTDYAEIIVKPEFKAEFIGEIAKDLKKNTSIGILELEGVSAVGEDNLDPKLKNWPFRRYERSLDPTWILSIPESWDHFLKSSKKSLRRKAKKAKKRLDSGEVTVKSTIGELDMETAFQTLVKLHQERFESKGEPGVFADPNFKSFLKEAVFELSKTERSEILIGFFGTKPIACHLYLHSENGGQLYQAGIASEFMALEPGHVMLTFAVKRAIEKQNQVFDFLRGDEPYKPYWGAVPHELKTIQCVSKAIVPTAVNQTYRAVKMMKNVCESWIASPVSH